MTQRSRDDTAWEIYAIGKSKITDEVGSIQSKTPDPFEFFPTGLVAAPLSPNAIGLSWNPAVTATSSYTILYSTDGVEYSEFDTVDGSTTTYTAQGLVPGATYYFEVVGVNSSGNDSSPSVRATAMTEPDPWDTQVGGPTLIGEGAQYNLSLSATQATSGPTFDHWMVDWGDGTAVSYYGITVTTASHTFAAGFPFSTITVTACTADIQADGSGNGGSNSLALTEQPINVDIVPIAPTGLSANVVTSTEADLTWSDNGSQAANGYNILRSDGGGDFNLIDTVAAGVTSYADDTIASGSSDTLQYEVEAFGDSQSIVSSPSQSPFVITAIDIPGLLVSQGTGSLGSVNLTWMYKGNDESGFVIQMADVTLGQSLHTALTPGPAGTSNQGSATITGLNAEHTYLFEIGADYTAGGTSATSETTFTVPTGNPSPPVRSDPNTSPPSPDAYKEIGHHVVAHGKSVIGKISSQYGLLYIPSGNSSFDSLDLGEVGFSRGQVVTKAGSFTVAGALNIGVSGYGSFTNAGSAAALGSMNIAGQGYDSNGSFFNQIAGSTMVGGNVIVGSTTPQSHVGLLAVQGGSFTCNGQTALQAGSTLDIQGPMSAGAATADVNLGSGTIAGLVLNPSTKLEFDLTDYSGTSATLNLGSSGLQADSGCQLLLGLADYHQTSQKTYTLIQAGGFGGIGSAGIGNSFNVSTATQFGYTTQFFPTDTSLSVKITPLLLSKQLEYHGEITASNGVAEITLQASCTMKRRDSTKFGHSIVLTKMEFLELLVETASPTRSIPLS